MSLTLDAADDDPDTKGTSEKDKKVQRDARSNRACNVWKIKDKVFPNAFHELSFTCIKQRPIRVKAPSNQQSFHNL